MKKITLSTLFLAFSLVCFGQTAFTEETFRALNQRLLADYPKFLNEETTPDYTFTSEVGNVYSLERLKKAFASGNKLTTWDLSDIKIKQIGNVAIVTGINKNSVFYANANTTTYYNLRFTYIYEYKDKNWKWLSSQHSEPPVEEKDKPEEIVKQWIREYNKDDVGFFKDRCTEDFIASNFGGQFFGKKMLVENRKSSTQDSEVEVLKAHQSGHVGIATGIMTYHHSQPDGSDNPDKVAFTFGMVKQNGKWMYATHQFATMNDDDPKEVFKQWVTEYNKDNKTFLLNKTADDLVGTVNGGAFYSRKSIENTTEWGHEILEASDMKSFQSGNLAVVMGVFTRHNKQADGSDKPVKQMFTATMQKRNGKWLYVGHHATDAKE